MFIVLYVICILYIEYSPRRLGEEIDLVMIKQIFFIPENTKRT